MKVEKRSNGCYRARKMYKGKTYTVNFDHKPTQKEVIEEFAIVINKPQSVSKMTFLEASKQYTNNKSNVLSPRTIKEYTETPNRIPEWFCSLQLEDITQTELNKVVNELSSSKSPKTVRNYHGFISAVLSEFYPSLKISTRLPQKRKIEPYIPTRDDIKNILEYAKGTDYEIPIKLGCYGLRRSEICALTKKDVNGNKLYINKAKVLDSGNNWTIKGTKTTASTRDIIVSEEIAEYIVEHDGAYTGHPNNITDFLTKAQKDLNIPKFSLHKLRHFFASEMSGKIPEADLLKMGGWETDHVMKAVYRHAQKDDEKKNQEIASSIISNIF